MNKTSKILLAFTTGALAGIVTGLLLAPDKRVEKIKKSKKKEEPEENLPPFFDSSNEEFDCVQEEMKK